MCIFFFLFLHCEIAFVPPCPFQPLLGPMELPPPRRFVLNAQGLVPWNTAKNKQVLILIPSQCKPTRKAALTRIFQPKFNNSSSINKKQYLDQVLSIPLSPLTNTFTSILTERLVSLLNPNGVKIIEIHVFLRLIKYVVFHVVMLCFGNTWNYFPLWLWNSWCVWPSGHFSNCTLLRLSESSWMLHSITTIYLFKTAFFYFSVHLCRDLHENVSV